MFTTIKCSAYFVIFSCLFSAPDTKPPARKPSGGPSPVIFLVRSTQLLSLDSTSWAEFLAAEFVAAQAQRTAKVRMRIICSTPWSLIFLTVFLHSYDITIRVLYDRFWACFRGSGGFTELQEACRNHFDLSWYLSDTVVTSYRVFNMIQHDFSDFYFFRVYLSLVFPSLSL